MEIKSAEFVISNTNVKKCPAGNLPKQCWQIFPYQYADW